MEEWITVVHEKEKRRYNKEWYSIWNQFKREFPELIRRGTSYEPYPYGQMDILVSIPGKGKLIYNPVGTSNGKIQWVEHWVDEQELKRKELEAKKRDAENRQAMYKTFLSMVRFYQREFGATQKDIAELSGYSRQTINEYMNGRAIPKPNTMRKIIKALDMDIDN